MTGNYKSEFAIPKCFSTGGLSFTKIFDLVCLYIALFLVDKRDCMILDSAIDDNSAEKTYSVKLTKERLNQICPRFNNQGSSYRRLRDALENAYLSVLDSNGFIHPEPLFIYREYLKGTLTLEFNPVFSHIFEKTHDHSNIDPINSENIVRYSGFTLFDINELCNLKTFKKARTFEIVHSKTYNIDKRETNITKLKLKEYYLAIGLITITINPPNNADYGLKCSLNESEITTKWKHVNERVFNGKPLQVASGKTIEAEKSDSETIRFLSRDINPYKEDNSSVEPPKKKSESKRPTYQKQKKKNSFHNFKERQYDFEQLEKEALNNWEVPK